MSDKECCKWRVYSAELIGTLALVFFGCGSAVIAGEYLGVLGISFAFGIVLLGMVYTIGSISGCHVNPAVTLSMLVTKRITLLDAVVYIIVQCVGAIIGAGLLLGIAQGLPGFDLAVNGLGQNGYGIGSPAGYSMGACLLAEVVLTFFFILVIFGATSRSVPAGFAGIPIGLALFLVHLVGIPITGTSVNPARSLGPAIFVGGTATGQLWLFWVAPLIGAVFAALVWRFVLEQKD